MPGPRRKLFRCLAGLPATSQASTPGTGIFAELVPDDDGESLTVAVTTSQSPGGQAFIDNLV